MKIVVEFDFPNISDENGDKEYEDLEADLNEFCQSFVPPYLFKIVNNYN